VAHIVGPKTNRIALSLLAIAAYLLFCVGLARYGYPNAAGPALFALLSIWSLGLVGLMFTEPAVGRFDAGAVTFVKAIWFNVGAVSTALLVPHTLRLLLLVAPLFGVLYTALHLDRRHMLAVAAVTWLSHLIGLLAANVFVATDLSFSSVSFSSISMDGLLFAAFTMMLLAMLYMGGEVTALRSAFARRRDRLNSAMEQLAELAMRDELTGLYNRRYIMDVLAQQQALANREHVGFTLLYCDLDHFKRVNDRFGHHCGDRVLCEFAKLATGVVRSVDYVARFGGEEFLLVLVGADNTEAMAVAERLGESTRHLTVAPGELGYRLTVSTGVASFRPGERVEDVIQRADLALYRAKSGGRDQIIVAS
jgi:diguanylate cyclase (GGDEF)-like protein